MNLTQSDTFSESTWRMHESTWQMQMIRSGDNGKTQSLSQINLFFFSVWVGNELIVYTHCMCPGGK